MRPDSLLLCTSWSLALSTLASAQAVVESQVLLGPPLPTALDGHFFGRALASLGDLDGDGSLELAVGEPSGADPERGATWILSVDSLGTVVGMRRVGLLGEGSSGDRLGFSLANLGDVDGNGIPDLAIGAPGVLPNPASAVLVALLEADESTLSIERHVAPPGSSGLFARAVAGIGDLDGDGVMDMAVGDPGRDDGGTDRGAIWIVFLNPDGSPKARARISATSGGFSGLLTVGEHFGSSLAALGGSGRRRQTRAGGGLADAR